MKLNLSGLPDKNYTTLSLLQIVVSSSKSPIKRKKLVTMLRIQESEAKSKRGMVQFFFYTSGTGARLTAILVFSFRDDLMDVVPYVIGVGEFSLSRRQLNLWVANVQSCFAKEYLFEGGEFDAFALILREELCD